MLFLLIIYLLFFSVSLAWGMTWVMERGEKKYHLGANYSRPIFLWASLIFIFSYIGNIVVFYTSQRAFMPLQISLFAALLVFAALKEKSYKAQILIEEQKVLEEINQLEKGLTNDPSNSSYHERLSELYERSGNMPEAELHAKTAHDMDPTERNKWRVKTLRQDIEEAAAGKP